MDAQPPAGWYQEGEGERYWDGMAWTDHRRSYAMAPPPPPYAGPAGGHVVASPRMAVAPKSPAISLLVSFFIPGVGSMVNGDVGRGLLILGLFIVGWILSIVLIGIPILIGVWVWGLVDGYQGAQRWNLRHGIIS